ncbi:MAG: hypothetical protein VKJ24_08690 [Synechococcales bacterium]|nr:hypothetical protein [Synechococcales bacterium]
MVCLANSSGAQPDNTNLTTQTFTALLHGQHLHYLLNNMNLKGDRQDLSTQGMRNCSSSNHTLTQIFQDASGETRAGAAIATLGDGG